MYDYVTSKPPLNEDTLMHYGIKGMKWHKRKGKSLERRAKLKRKLAGIKDPSMVTHINANGKLVASHRDEGKAGSRSWQNGPKLTVKRLDTLRKKNNLESSASNSHSGGTGVTGDLDQSRYRAKLKMGTVLKIDTKPGPKKKKKR